MSEILRGGIRPRSVLPRANSSPLEANCPVVGHPPRFPAASHIYCYCRDLNYGTAGTAANFVFCLGWVLLHLGSTPTFFVHLSCNVGPVEYPARLGFDNTIYLGVIKHREVHKLLADCHRGTGGQRSKEPIKRPLDPLSCVHTNRLEFARGSTDRGRIPPRSISDISGIFLT